MNDTIAAISTACGAAAIGIVRLSGPEAIPVAESVFRAKSGKRLREMAGYNGVLGRVYDHEGDVDEAVTFVYRAPKSYTGEDVVEISCHGGTYIVQKVFHMCVENGARPAAPGEFTQRAFLAGKMGLDQAEAVMELISAQGENAMRAALSVRDGAMSAAVRQIIDRLLAQSAHLAAWADYPEEDLEEIDICAVSAALCAAEQEIDALLSTGENGRLMRDGIATAIVGKPNVGKSTLMNLLSGTNRSIVTDIPGTTRDVVEDAVMLGGYVLRLWDTAGLRETADEVERIGVERARQRLEEADLVLAMFDASDSLDTRDELLLHMLAGKPCIAILNKNDLPQRTGVSLIKKTVPRVVLLSARTGEGKEELEKQVLEALSLQKPDMSAPVVLAERQRRCLREAKAHVEEALFAVRNMVTLDAVNICIDCALDALLALTGERATDAVVHEVFARFCVGK